ncbi:MAG: FtsQ-type POTRA domain-containing protein [Longimicrobiales bacterium]
MSTRRKGRMRRWARWVGAGLVVAAAVALTVLAPRLLRQVDAFRVQTVEVAGTRFLEPYAVVRAAGLDGPSSVFDDVDAWRAGVLTLSLVDDVRIRRRIPSTVRLEVREVEPVALVGGERLRPVDARGRLIDLEPAGIVLDLPVVVGAPVKNGQVASPAGASAVATLTALAVRAPELADGISQVEVGPGALRIAFRGQRLEAVLPSHPSEVQLLQLRLAHADLRARGELGRVRTIDVRFRDQVVVSFLDRPVS